MNSNLLLPKRLGLIKPKRAEIEYYDRDSVLEEIERNLEMARKFPEVKNYSRNKHYIGVRPAAATAATARAAACILWNPHSTSRINLWEVWIVNTAATAFNVSMTRATARGTASTSVAMAIGNAVANDTAAPSGATVDTAWSVAPTISAVDMIRWNIPGAIGSGIILPFPDPIDITATSGIALITPTALAFQISDITWVFSD